MQSICFKLLFYKYTCIWYVQLLVNQYMGSFLFEQRFKVIHDSSFYLLICCVCDSSDEICVCMQKRESMHCDLVYTIHILNFLYCET